MQRDTGIIAPGLRDHAIAPLPTTSFARESHMPQAAPLATPHADPAATSDDAAATTGRAHASAVAERKTEDQIAKEERQAQLKREGEGLTSCYVPDNTLLTVVVYAGTTAVVLAFLFGFGLLLFDKRTHSGPKSWRSWLRGRF
jgi:hypothetical protein